MRILQVGKFYHPYRGGIETFLKSLCEGLLARGHDVRCLVANTGRQSETEYVDGVRVVRVGRLGSFRSVSLCPRFVSVFRALARDVDLVHVHQQNPLADLAVLVNSPSVPLVVTCHSGIVRQRLGRVMWQPILARVWQRAQRVVVASPPLAGLFADAYQCARPRTVIPFGIDLQTLGALDNARFHGEETGAPLLLSVGRLVSYKGFEYLIAALTHVAGARLVLVGDGPLLRPLQEQAGTLNVRDRVTFAGEVSSAQLADLYRRCAVFVLPSVTPAEAFGMVQLEAMAYGKPVVSTDLPTGVPWVNRHGETGLVVPPRSSPALAGALNTLLASPTLRQEMGAAGRRRVEQEFTVQRMIERYDEVYEEAREAHRVRCEAQQGLQETRLARTWGRSTP
jgi:rhamnosyl/mannosyltransferase